MTELEKHHMILIEKCPWIIQSAQGHSFHYSYVLLRSRPYDWLCPSQWVYRLPYHFYTLVAFRKCIYYDVSLIACILTFSQTSQIRTFLEMSRIFKIKLTIKKISQLLVQKLHTIFSMKNSDFLSLKKVLDMSIIN